MCKVCFNTKAHVKLVFVSTSNNLDWISHYHLDKVHNHDAWCSAISRRNFDFKKRSFQQLVQVKNVLSRFSYYIHSHPCKIKCRKLLVLRFMLNFIPFQMLYATIYASTVFFITEQPQNTETYLQVITIYILLTICADAFGIFLGTLVNPIVKRKYFPINWPN